MTQMLVCFLGTSGGMPTPHRALPCVAVRFAGTLMLFDCGESTQRQLLASGLGLPRELKIFITHRHADHLLGIPGVLYTLSMMGREDPVEIYGHASSCEVVNRLLEALETEVGFGVEVKAVGPGLVYRGREFRVEAQESDHSTESLCYSVLEDERPGRMRVEYLEELGIPRGPLWGRLQRGEPITFQGRMVRPEEAVDPPRRGRKIVYTGDTRFSEKIVRFADQADLLIHDATFDQSLSDRAREEGHSTASEAATAALQAKARLLALFHISPRYHGKEEVLLSEARRIFPNTILPSDLDRIEIPYPE
ncbi:MAG: ribonuclease Z [Nitrososphaerota archaeon]